MFKGGATRHALRVIAPPTQRVKMKGETSVPGIVFPSMDVKGKIAIVTGAGQGWDAGWTWGLPVCGWQKNCTMNESLIIDHFSLFNARWSMFNEQ